MKHCIYPLVMLVIISFLSCGGKTSKEESDIDTIWNEKVQDTFFGMKLGEQISPDSVISLMEQKRFINQSNYSISSCLIFEGYSKYFSFGGLSFEALYVYIDNGVFSGIKFFNPHKDKVEALDSYNSIKNTVAEKYDITERNPKDTTTYAECSVFGRNKVNIGIVCFRYESVEHEIWIGTSLCYWYKGDIKPSDEL